MRNFFLIIGFLSISVAASAQNATRQYISHSKNGNTLEITTSDGKYSIRFYSTGIAETSFIPIGETYNPESHAVILQPQAVTPTLSEAADALTFSLGSFSVRIKKSPLQVSYYLRDKLLLSEKSGYTKRDSTETIDFNLDASETLYGGGARVLGMNRRGNRLQLYNRAHYGYETRSELMNFTMPLVLSSKIYAVHFDNAPIGYLDLDSKKNNTLTYETISGRKTYQVIVADDWYKLIENYTALTGRQPMPPRWAFGNFASRFGYHSQTETERTIKKFRDEKIPVDAIILDLYWFGKDIKGTMGNLDVFRDSFPDFEGMVSRLNRDHVKTIPITEPFILTTSSKWQEAVNKNILATDKDGKPFTYDFYFGNTGLIDIFKPEGRDWFWNIYRDLANKGVGGIWGDLGEPEVHPPALQHATGSADEVHNIYGHNWAKLIFDGYKREFPNQRPFILMRSGYSGSQRYGMIPWSGDVNRTWGGLSGQTEIALQMGIQGMGYMHSDLGGFAGANLDNELYTRWLQYGVYQPIFRPHAQEEVASEPVFRDEKTKALAKKSIELRYQMLPYNYTLAFENSRSGKPLMRPMFFEEPGNEKLLSRADQYLWGDAFLVAPVITAGEPRKEIYFPKGANWFELGVKKYPGGQRHTVPVKEDAIPVFVRGGAFIPMAAQQMQSTAEFNSSDLVIRYINDPDIKKSSGMFYDDDGITPEAFEKGNYEILRFTSELRGKNIIITVTSEPGNSWSPKERNILYEVYDLNRKATYPITLKSGKTKKIRIKQYGK
ncbi:MAG TPA: TIM-barrel domain-containing protein [Flavobacterium sp.]|jgi:alpha-glucosidase (family GH31 glycosyl hydrolase)